MTCSGGTWGHRRGHNAGFHGGTSCLGRTGMPQSNCNLQICRSKMPPSRSADPGARPRPFTPKVEPRSHHRQVDCSENLPTYKVLHTRQHRCLWSAMLQQRRDTQGLADQELRNDRDPVLNLRNILVCQTRLRCQRPLGSASSSGARRRCAVPCPWGQ